MSYRPVKRYSVEDFPPATSEDLDFDDPPPFLKSLIEQVFWCLSARVRQIIRDKYPRRVFFCFHRGVCTWACEDNPALAKERIKAHHQAEPHHYINPHFSHLKEWVQEMERRKCIRDELRDKARFSVEKYREVHQERERDRDRVGHHPFRAKGITYRYPDTQQYKRRRSRSKERSSSRSSSSSSYVKLRRTVSPGLESKEEERVNTPERFRRDIHQKSPEKSYRDTKNISSEMMNLSESHGSSDNPLMERKSSEPSGKSVSELVHEKLRKNKLKQDKIIIGPRKGFKLTKQNLIRLEKLERMKSLEILEEESGSCKYCGMSLPIKQLKQHYLNHNKLDNTEINKAVEKVIQDIDNDLILQENSISSSDSSDNVPGKGKQYTSQQIQQSNKLAPSEKVSVTKSKEEKMSVCNEVSTTESQTQSNSNLSLRTTASHTLEKESKSLDTPDAELSQPCPMKSKSSDPEIPKFDTRKFTSSSTEKPKSSSSKSSSSDTEMSQPMKSLSTDSAMSRSRGGKYSQSETVLTSMESPKTGLELSERCPMVTVKTELCDPGMFIKQEPQTDQVVAHTLTGLTNESEHVIPSDDQSNFKGFDSFLDTSTDENIGKTSDPSQVMRENGEDRAGSLAGEIQAEKVEEENISERKKIVQKFKKLEEKKVDNLRLVRKEGVFAVNKNKMNEKWKLQNTGTREPKIIQLNLNEDKLDECQVCKERFSLDNETLSLNIITKQLSFSCSCGGRYSMSLSGLPTLKGLKI